MKITVYIPTYNYGKYIEKAINSILSQTIKDWELIIINDGSTDNTKTILKKYANHSKIRIIDQAKKGLSVSNNVALRLSNAKYIMRLDADDYIDENALLVLSSILDAKPEIGLVYPDYYLIDENDEIMEIVRRKKISEEALLLDLPAHGACTMFRKECLLQLGGYAEEFKCQDGYELWLRFMDSYKPYNVNIPLFYYRQHNNNLTKNHKEILETRRRIKRSFVGRFRKNKIPKVLAIVPVRKQTNVSPEHPFALLAGKPLLSYTLEQALKAELLDRIVVTSDSSEVLKYSARFNNVSTIERPRQLTASNTRLDAIVRHALNELKRRDDYKPDAIMILCVNSPLRRSQHIDKAIDTMVIFNVDTVISVLDELAFCYFHGNRGLVSIQKSRDLRIEKESIYKETGAILLTKIKEINNKTLHGKRIGHINMLPEESVKIKSHFDLWLAEGILTDWMKVQ